MRKSFVATLLLLGAAATLATGALAAVSDISNEEVVTKLLNVKQSKELQALRLRTSAPGDTTWVGYNPAYAGSNYWSVGVGDGQVKPGGTGYWDWETAVNGDSLQGWWPTRFFWTVTGGLTPNDIDRPWFAIEQANAINGFVPGAPGPNGQRRTEGVVGVWHSDPGNTVDPIVLTTPGANPLPPTWTPLSGSRSAWCGIRASGDLTVVDPETGNAYNSDAAKTLYTDTANLNGQDLKLPGYLGQWDQMLYRDVTIPATGTVQVRFRFSTTMSPDASASTTAGTGWFEKDPLNAVLGNFIQNRGNPTPPRDSFQVYVGVPVDPVPGNDPPNDFIASDGLTYEIFDVQRRWFSEVIDVNSGAPYLWLFGAAGNNAATQQTVSFDAATFGAGTVRLVFRNHTDRAFDDRFGSVAGQYSSGGAGAVQLDDVEIDTGSGFALIPGGDFELETDIDNDPTVLASDKWKSTGKPPAVYSHHLPDASALPYRDLCGQIGTAFRICDLAGGIVSAGNFDQSERLSGDQGTADYEHIDGIMSPTINLATTGPSTANNMGITGDMADATEDYAIVFDMYYGAHDLFSTGNTWRYVVQAYPCNQNDGVRAWGPPQVYTFHTFNPDPLCSRIYDAFIIDGMWRNSGAGGIPDSVRVGVYHTTLCYIFSLSADCGGDGGAEWDNISCAMTDGARQPLTVNIGDWYADVFPANENSNLVGDNAAFDTCAAYITTGFNNAQQTGDDTRLSLAGYSITVASGVAQARMDMIFRILPGPANYVTPGERASGLRVVPTSTTAISQGDGSFWSVYTENNGPFGSPSGHPAGTFASRWSEVVWNSARCDTSDFITFPKEPQFGQTAIGGGEFAGTLHEDDPNYNTLGILKNRCFVNDTASTTFTDISCGRANEPYPFPPAWVTALPADHIGWDGNLQTREGTKILPDGLFTPGTHVQYFFRLTDLSNSEVFLFPDTNKVTPQGPNEFDALRWQHFSVLPDAWKFNTYGGAGNACALYVDWDDSRGDERWFISTADSIGATADTKRGAHNGWSARGDATSINDPAGFVSGRNASPGTTFDMYQIHAAESVNNPVATLGSRTSQRETDPSTRAYGKDARNAPTLPMLEAYYKILVILTGDLNDSILGPFTERSAKDIPTIENFILGSTQNANRGVMFEGIGLVESLDPGGAPDPFLANFSVSLRNPSYLSLSGVASACADLITQAVINPRGDIYGMDNSCTTTKDVFNVETGGAPATLYQPVGNPINFPYVGSVYHAPVGPNYWASLVDGWQVSDVYGRYCETSQGRLAYFYWTFNTAFSTVCNINGPGPITNDVPNNRNGRIFMAVQNNPVYSGVATVNFGLTKDSRVTLKIYDVSGRLVRTLVDGQMFKAGEHKITWDGISNSGRSVPRGVYFSSWETDGGASVQRKITFLK
jgi:hypothetical protein